MAKPKNSAAEPRAAATDDRVMISQLKGTPEFREWVRELAQHKRMQVLQLIEMSLLEAAEKSGFNKPAPLRKIR